ncbi:hypothetical protein F5X97DRAFT_339313 [Nemania serpens]|nr:hypothetical protein F5X97DRAFT_339313 [Nemania serpens]
MSLLKWIGESAEIHVLKSFFSIKSSTIRAVWDNLYRSSIRLQRVRAYTILVQLDLSINTGLWITRRPSCLIDAIYMGATDTIKELLEKTSTDPNSLVSPHILDFSPLEIGLAKWSPLGFAAFCRELETIRVLLSHGANVNHSFALDDGGFIRQPLFAVLSHPINRRVGLSKMRSVASIMDCIRALLDAGSNIDIYQNDYPEARWGWRGPGRPLWFIDLMWITFPTEAGMLAELPKLSSRMQSELTVSGVCLAANQGQEHLRQYLASRQLPNGDDRQAVLQIALSEAADLGLSESVDCLLQLGVDPNVKYIDVECSRYAL